jgi:hypothetical protein
MHDHTTEWKIATKARCEYVQWFQKLPEFLYIRITIINMAGTLKSENPSFLVG